LRHDVQAVQVRVDDLFALDADDMRMGMRPVPIVSVASIRESQLKHFAKRFDQYNIPVNRRKAHCRERIFQLYMNIFDTGMTLAFSQNFNDSQALRRYLVAVVPQFADDGFKSDFEICH
jgi:hypothetical protein